MMVACIREMVVGRKVDGLSVGMIGGEEEGIKDDI